MNQFKITSVLEKIGNTPVVEIKWPRRPTLLAKLEYLNPGGSIKDRAALFMIEEAERKGLLKPGGTLVEATSGNQGIAIAMIGAIKGYKVVITTPDRTSAEKLATLRAYGAEVYVCPNTDSLEDPNSYHMKAEELEHSIPGAFMPNQYYNLDNAEAHYRSTGPEIWEQTQGKLTHCILAMGTCGTICGVSRYLKEKNPAIKIIGVDAATSLFSSPKNPKAYKSEGIGVDVLSDMLKQSRIDQVIPVTDDEIFKMTRDMAARGYLVGLSSGAVMHAAMEYAKGLTEKDIGVMVFADSGRAYLSKVFMR